VPDVVRDFVKTNAFATWGLPRIHGLCSTPIQGSSGNRILKRLALLLHLPALLALLLHLLALLALLATPLLGGGLLTTSTPQVHHALLATPPLPATLIMLVAAHTPPLLLSQARR
tara:strand:+ start:383 stop:727 length:345 start_codon:yes stop_codon:yes gene_type:complete